MRRRACRYAVVECCMGGLLDTTNAINKKAVAVITSISLEHTAYLGDTLLQIARHKAGIIRDCPAVISACVPQEVRPIFYARGARLSLPRRRYRRGRRRHLFYLRRQALFYAYAGVYAAV